MVAEPAPVTEEGAGASPDPASAPRPLREQAAPESQAVLGGGCFWCLEAVFQGLQGVDEVASGYAGGHDPNPNYGTVCAGVTGHAEVVRIRFRPEEISFRTLLDVFFTIHDPTTPDRQGADVGTQYRSIILYDGDEQEAEARLAIRELEEEGRWPDPIVTELRPLEVFHPAEAEHHDYYRRHPDRPYCSVVISPKLQRARARFGHLFRS